MRELLTKPKRIKAKKAKEMAGEGKAMLVDVRTSEEFANGHIPGAMLLPLDVLAGRAAAALPDKEANIIVNCQSGARSAIAAAQLAAMGYKNVYDLGGIIGWPYEITR